MATEQIKPRIIAFEVTRRCRYYCRHCRAGAGPDFAERELSTEQCKKILDSVASFCIGPKKPRRRVYKGQPIIILTGGEPMERADIYELVEHGRKLGLRMVMATCGYLLDADSIKKLKKSGIAALSFSLDGASAETHDEFRETRGAFDAVISAARLAREAEIPFQINTTISKLNIAEAFGIADLARHIGAYCFNPFLLVPTGRGEELDDLVLDPIEYEVFLNELLGFKLTSDIQIRITCAPQAARIAAQSSAEKRASDINGCMGGRGFGFISYKGDVQTCGFLQVSAGNLIKKRYNFGRIWEKSKLLEEVRDISHYTGKCRQCEYVGLCGGCRARAFATSGDYLGTDPVCPYKPGEKS